MKNYLKDGEEIKYCIDTLKRCKENIMYIHTIEYGKIEYDFITNYLFSGAILYVVLGLSGMNNNAKVTYSSIALVTLLNILISIKKHNCNIIARRNMSICKTEINFIDDAIKLLNDELSNLKSSNNDDNLSDGYLFREYFYVLGAMKDYFNDEEKEYLYINLKNKFIELGFDENYIDLLIGKYRENCKNRLLKF